MYGTCGACRHRFRDDGGDNPGGAMRDDHDAGSSAFAGSETFTWDEVVPGLFQGNFPEGDDDWAVFDDVVSMSTAAPSPRLRADGLWIRLPIWDGEMEEADAVRDAARTVAERVTAGRRVLVHCWAGLNRSGVVSARALMFMGLSATDAIAAVRAARGEDALFNDHFVAWLHAEAGEVELVR
jgi:hypothetical protein